MSQLVMAWTSEIIGDFDSVLREALAALEGLHSQDEPFWTALAAYTAGLVETTVGRYDDARPHLTEMRDLAERLENPWLAAVSRVYLGMLALAQARPEEEARDLLDEALGADRFDQMYATGSRLSQQEAVAAVRDRRGAGTAAP